MKIEAFTADENLLYAIQTTTKEPTEQVLSYFYQMATEVIKAAQYSKSQRPYRKLTIFYPNTGIPYTIEVWGWKANYTDKECNMRVNVFFPKSKMDYDDLGDLVEKIAEAHLLGGDLPKVEPFDKPMFKIPAKMRKFFKDDERIRSD